MYNYNEEIWKNIRWIGNINKKNISIIERLFEMGIQIKHLNDPPPLDFDVSDSRLTFRMNLKIKNPLVFPQIITTNEPNLIKQYRILFEELWNKGLDGSLRINELRSIIRQDHNSQEEDEFTEIIENTHKTEQIFIEMIEKATSEVLMILSSPNAFLREEKLGIWKLLVKKIQESKKFNASVLIPIDESIDHKIKEIQMASTLTNHLNHNNNYDRTSLVDCRIKFRKIEKIAEILTTCVIVDKNLFLGIELKDDSKANLWEAIGTTTYSNTKSTVLSYVSIFESLWNQMELYDIIRQSNDQIQLHDKMQHEFINVAAHELRTPTQSIIGYCELLDIIPEKANNYITTIKRNAKRLEQLTENILDISKIEYGNLRLQKSKFDIITIISNIIEDLKITNNKVNIKLNYLQLAKNNRYIYADKNRIHQVITNLLNNALKFANGLIEISLKKIDEPQEISTMIIERSIVVTIKDNGKGISETIQPRLFDKFVTNSSIGTGVGLYISKNIIEAHNGIIWGRNIIDNKNNNKILGAEFGFTLPLYDKFNRNNY